MKFRMVTVAVSLVVLTAIATGAGWAAHTQGVTKDTIKIGFFGPITGSGYLWGKLVMNGAEIVYNETNKAGGINGRKIVTVREDDRCEVAAGVAAMKKLVHAHRVFLVHGGGCSNPTIAAREEVERANLPFVNFLAVADKIVLPRAPYIWTTTIMARAEGELMADFVGSSPAFKRLAVISQRDSWGVTRYEPMIERLKKLGKAPVADEEITVDANDATTQLLRIRQANPDVLLIVVYPKPGAVIMRSLHKMGMLQLPVVSGRVIADLTEFERQVGLPGAVDNFYSLSESSFTPDEPKAARWAELLKQSSPEDRMSIYTLSGIGSAQVVVDALRRAGPDLTAEAFKKAMDSTCGRVSDVYAGEICYTADDPLGNKTAAWIKLDKGKVINVGTKFPAGRK